MGKKMGKDMSIVLCLLVLLGIAWSIGVHRNLRHLSDIVRITDTRTEHLRDRIQSMEKRIAVIERRKRR